MPVVERSSATEILIRRVLLVGVVVSHAYGTTASLVAFGDSYSDDGHGANNAVHAALGTTQAASGYFPMAPYAQGRFSNGPIYLEIAAASLSNVLNSYATGAAVTGAPGSASVLPVYPPYAGLTSVKTVPVPSGLQQVLCPGCER
ncbi:hypothetical protein MMC14_010611 [Varicellaria rhodocarpa]|nr:hypothetical protein [Varicellaria rhodocarpa]